MERSDNSLKIVILQLLFRIPLLHNEEWKCVNVAFSSVRCSEETCLISGISVERWHVNALKVVETFMNVSVMELNYLINRIYSGIVWKEFYARIILFLRSWKQSFIKYSEALTFRTILSSQEKWYSIKLNAVSVMVFSVIVGNFCQNFSEILYSKIRNLVRMKWSLISFLTLPPSQLNGHLLPFYLVNHRLLALFTYISTFFTLRLFRQKSHFWNILGHFFNYTPCSLAFLGLYKQLFLPNSSQ